MSKKNSLHKSIWEINRSMLSPNNSKREDKKTGSTAGKIYSYATYHTYQKRDEIFEQYIKRFHPECVTLEEARQYVNEWLDYEKKRLKSNGEPQSSWTLHLDAKAVGKLFGIRPEDPDYWTPPARRKSEAIRSRYATDMDVLNESRHRDLVCFCRATGCRRNIIQKLLGTDLYTGEDLAKKLSGYENADRPLTSAEKYRVYLLHEALDNFVDCDYFILHRTDKGGRERYAPVVGQYTDLVVERMRNSGEKRVWIHVPKSLDIHSYRNDYSCEVYRRYGRAVEDIPYDAVNKGTGHPYQKDVYVFRGEDKGKRLDKKAMMKASIALGHSRVDVVASSYLRGV